jgi:hypothetical protein
VALLASAGAHLGLAALILKASPEEPSRVSAAPAHRAKGTVRVRLMDEPSSPKAAAPKSPPLGPPGPRSVTRSASGATPERSAAKGDPLTMTPVATEGGGFERRDDR